MNWCANSFLSMYNQPSSSPRENVWLLSSCQTVFLGWHPGLRDELTLAIGLVRPVQSFQWPHFLHNCVQPLLTSIFLKTCCLACFLIFTLLSSDSYWIAVSTLFVRYSGRNKRTRMQWAQVTWCWIVLDPKTFVTVGMLVMDFIVMHRLAFEFAHPLCRKILFWRL